MYRSLVIGVVSLLGFASTAVATLTPTKASQLADLTTDYQATCPINAHAYVLNRIQKSDGTTASFTIAPKHVFVVTAAEIGAQLIPTGHRYEVSLFRELPDQSNVTSIVTFTDAVSQGNAGVLVNLPIGSVVKSGVLLCVVVLDFDGSGAQSVPNVMVHGFFAKDS